MRDFNEKMNETDLGEDIKIKEELIEQAKQLKDSDNWNETVEKVMNLKRRWKRTSYFESAYEDELAEEFEKTIDALFEHQKEMHAENQKTKETYIAQAQKLVNPSNWNEASKEMSELMTKWKACGSAGKNTDDELWETFNGIRQAFYEGKQKYWEEVKERFSQAHEAKTAIIAQAKELKDSESWQQTSAKFNELMDEWKKVGSAGHEHEETLWNEFNEVRQAFYARRHEFYEALHEKQAQHLECKKELVEKAKAIEESHDYSKENTEKIKNLSNEWKQVGSCGKEHDDQIWSEFRSVLDDYFAGLKKASEERHQKWIQNMKDAINRKQEMILNQKRQIKRLHDSMVGLISQREVDDVMDQIEDREDFVKQLEEEIADIENKINR